ncbi:MAG TPA: DUF4199 domain-containing protein [Salinimicrobium sp.]|nr:DUF4199 domain-containing protein [Salinimicrobium sp.]
MKNYKIEFKWAVIFIIASLLWMVLEKSLGWHDELIAKHPVYTLLFSVIAVLIYVFALIDKKKNFYRGNMSWTQGFLSGIVISIIVALSSPLTQYITFEFISPEYLDNAANFAVENNRMSAEAAAAFFNQTSYLIQAFFGALAMGLVTSALVAFFVKTKNRKH